MTTKTTTTRTKRIITRPSGLGGRALHAVTPSPQPSPRQEPLLSPLPSGPLPYPRPSALSSFLRSACLCSRNSAPVTCCWGWGWSLTHSEVLGSVIYPGHPGDPSPANLNCVLNPSYWPGPCYKLRRPPIALLLPPALLPGLHLPRELCCHFTSTHHIPPTDYRLSRSGPTWKMPELALPLRTLIWTAHQPLKRPVIQPAVPQMYAFGQIVLKTKQTSTQPSSSILPGKSIGIIFNKYQALKNEMIVF
uniref:Uncharacterized protein n=1 Tax=Papio anubis TaxID=9555 RepID=A0A096MN24_PAPAN